MARKKKETVYDKELRLYTEAYAKAENKYKRQLRKDADLKIEDFGLSSSMFKEPTIDTKQGRPSVKQLRAKRSELEEFTSRKYGLKKIGTSLTGGEVKAVYMPKNVYKKAVERINAQNKFRATLSKAIDKAGGYSYARLTKNGIVKEKSTYYNAGISKSMDMIPIRISIIGGKDIGYKGNLFTQEKVMTPETFKAEYGRMLNYGGMSNKATSVSDIRILNLKDSWIKGLKANVSYAFGREIEQTLDELNIDAIDFLGLFHLTSVFDFDFIYDVVLSADTKKDQIRSEIEAFRQDKKAYKAFRKEMAKLE